MRIGHDPAAVAPSVSEDMQRATLRIAAGKRVSLTMEVAVTSRGLVSIGALVSSILLSTAVVVAVATRRPPAA
ncbi:MAG: hypothetical protein ACRYFW_04755 [Janthinobacterium lividum]